MRLVIEITDPGACTTSGFSTTPPAATYTYYIDSSPNDVTSDLIIQFPTTNGDCEFSDGVEVIGVTPQVLYTDITSGCSDSDSGLTDAVGNSCSDYTQ